MRDQSPHHLETAPEARPLLASRSRPAIEFVGVHKWYGEFHVLRDIRLAVGTGERVVVCGPSGSGKSTLIRCVNRLEEHQRGAIRVHGEELTSSAKQIDRCGARSAWSFSNSTCSRI